MLTTEVIGNIGTERFEDYKESSEQLMDVLGYAQEFENVDMACQNEGLMFELGDSACHYEAVMLRTEVGDVIRIMNRENKLQCYHLVMNELDEYLAFCHIAYVVEKTEEEKNAD